MTDPTTRELLKEVSNGLERYLGPYVGPGTRREDLYAMKAKIDAHLAATMNACPKCDGWGWTVEYSTDANGYRQVQVQCEACKGTGRAAPSESAMEILKQVREADNVEFFTLSDTDAAALIEGYGRRVPRAMLEEIFEQYPCYIPGKEPNAVRICIDAIAAKHGVKVEENHA